MENGHIKEIGREGVDWIYLSEDQVQWKALVNSDNSQNP
jgi:hypothetical protein